MTKYASGEIGLTEMIERAPIYTPFVYPVCGKKEAHKAMRDAHVVAKRKNCKVSTSIMRAVDVGDYDYTMTLVRVTVVERLVVGEVIDPKSRADISGVDLSPERLALEIAK